MTGIPRGVAFTISDPPVNTPNSCEQDDQVLAGVAGRPQHQPAQIDPVPAGRRGAHRPLRC